MQGEVFDACVTFAERGDPPNRHFVELRFSDEIVLELSVPTAASAGSTLELGALEDAAADASRATADVTDFRGFEGAQQSLCTTQPGFPGNAATSGSARVDTIASDGGGHLASIDGALDATFEGCTIEPLGVSGAKLVVHATF